MDNAPDSLDLQLKELVAQAVAAPAKSRQRRQLLSQVVRLLQHSGRVWRQSSPEYQDALQNTWIYLCQCPEKYDPERGSVITWLNTTLRYRLQDIYKAKAQEQRSRLPPLSPDGENYYNPVENISAPAPIPPMLEETRQWIESDPEGVLRSTHLKGRPDVTCQILLLRRFPPPVSWQTIADEFGLSLSTAPMFYKRKCLPLLRQFGLDQGYFEES